MALRIKERGASSTMYSWEERLSAAPLEWKHIQESFKARRIMADGAIVLAGSEFVFAGYAPVSNRGWGRLRPTACAIPRDGKGD